MTNSTRCIKNPVMERWIGRSEWETITASEDPDKSSTTVVFFSDIDEINEQHGCWPLFRAQNSNRFLCVCVCVSILPFYHGTTQHQIKKSWGGKNKPQRKPSMRQHWSAGNTRRFNCPWCHGRYQWSWKPYIELKNCWRMNCQKATSPLEFYVEGEDEGWRLRLGGSHKKKSNPPECSTFFSQLGYHPSLDGSVVRITPISTQWSSAIRKGSHNPDP